MAVLHDEETSALERKCFHMYEESGRYKVLVKVADIFWNDTNKLLEVKT